MSLQPQQLSSSDSKLGYLSMTINYVLASSINQFSKRDYGDVHFNLEQLELIVKRLDELKTKCDKSQSFKLYMSLVLNRFMAYLSSPNEESMVAKLCEAVFDDEYAFALTHQELNDLQVHLCKHLMYLIKQDFFHENKEIMDEYVDKYGVWVANDCGSASQMPSYSLEQMCQVMNEYLKQYVNERTSSVLHHLSEQLVGQDCDENELISRFSSSHTRQPEASEESHHLRDSDSATALTSLAQNIKQLKLTSENKNIAAKDFNQKLSPRVVVASRPRSSRSENLDVDVNNNHEMAVPDLNFGDDGTKKSVFDSSQPRAKKMWSHHETCFLALGVHEFGKGKWVEILNKYKDEFENRTNVALKDRWRVLEENPVEMRLYKKQVEDYLNQKKKPDS